MWCKSNWCERIIFISLFGLIILVSSNLIFQQVISNIWLILYTLLIMIFTIWLSCRDIQFLLEQSVPLKTEPTDVLAQYSQISAVKILYHTVKKFLCLGMCPKRSNVESKIAVFGYSSSDISVISNVIENKCIWSWYSQYVSKEVEFPLACKQLLEQMVSKVFQVSSNIDTVSFYSDALGAFLRHCKEYKRAQKRMAKIGQGRIEEYYRCTHPTSPQRNSLTTCMRGKSTQSHCLLLVRCFLKELLPWELWGTPQSLLLASILAKRLDEYITTSLSNPTWIKFRLMNVINPDFKIKDVKLTDANCTNENQPPAKQEIAQDLDSSTPECPTPEVEKASPDVAVKPEPALQNIEDQSSKSSIESALSNLISSSTAPILQRAEIDDANSKLLLQANPVDKNVIIEGKASQPINISASPAHTKKLNNSNEVKIYDKVMEGSVKTWNSDNDLECVSLGHDLLASLDGDIETRFGRLWEADGVDGSESWSPNPPSTGSSTKTPHGLWFGEEDNLDMDLADDSPPKQNTNNHQTNVSLNNPHTDEAAGVMEGILDFGIAGLRKGLRLTGLQESPTADKAETNTKPSEGLSSITSTLGHVLSRKNSQSEENFGKMDSQNDKNNTQKGSEPVDISKSNNSQHLVKQQRVTSQDSSYFNTVSKEKDSQIKETESSSFKDEGSLPSSYLDAIAATGTESPEYEYEEPADFASTIAKLRHLLQQKTSDVTPKTQDDSNIPDVTHSMIQSPHSKPASATQPTNSPIHKITPPQTGNSVISTKSEEIVSSPSMDGDFGFTILSQNSSDLVEAEEALNHKIEQISLMNVPQTNVNNMQRLDKLFTRTVTGVFNTIKTAVGGDSLAEGVSAHPEMQSVIDKQTLVRPHQHKDDWIFVEGEMEVSKIVSKLLMERRGFCVVETEVEAGQDMLEVLGTTAGHPDKKISTTPTSPCVNDDLDESEVLFGCPVYQMCMELVAVVLGGIMQKDAVVKCISIVVADMLEDVLQNKVKQLNTWLGRWIVGALHSLHTENEEAHSMKSENMESHNVSIEMDQLRDELLTIIPDILFTILGKEEMNQAIAILLSSVEYSLINRDLVFNLLDVFMLHFTKACSSQNAISTPPPSA